MTRYATLRPLLFAVDPERAHRLTLVAARAAGRFSKRAFDGLPIDLMGLLFPNRVGLAAGFDKNGEALNGLGRLGFGFIEVGTVTPRPQPGQPRPRLFRLPASRAVINRLGFPSDGAEAVAERLRRRRYGGIVGVNIGKNADTPIDTAIDDYISCLRTFADTADYITINISSPNTRGLRDLHTLERLEPLLTGLLCERSALRRQNGRHLPLVLKVSPDLGSDALSDVARIAQKVALDGIIATNTTIRRDDLLREQAASESGGLSGAPLYQLSLQTVAMLRSVLGPSFPLIGVGGIDTPAKALSMIKAGANLVQLYTGLIYQGPSLIAACIQATRSLA